MYIYMYISISIYIPSNQTGNDRVRSMRMGFVIQRCKVRNPPP